MLKNGIYEQVINNRIKTELLEAKANDKYIEQVINNIDFYMKLRIDSLNNCIIY